MWTALLLVASFQVLTAITPISVPFCQEGKEYDCGSGVLRCVPNEWKCDNVKDCDDGSDETGCNYAHNCSKEFMLCSNGVCASKEFKCDGEKDCSDGSDELHCGYYANLTAPNTNSTCHSVKQFECGSGTPLCIPAQWKCDNVPDCHNGSDEVGCTYNSTCPTDHMLCTNGDCVHMVYKCDGDNDCADGSDENNCVTEKDKPAIVDDVPECKSPRIRCSSGHCLRAELVCDGQFDCSDGEDEENCTRNDGDQNRKFECHPGQSHCFNENVCIPHSFFCDGVPDCEDGSDELNCGERAPSKEDIFSGLAQHLRSCRASGMFICKPKNGKMGVCIPMDATCNGVKECPLGDDEPEKCKECDTKECEHGCQNTPRGAKCICHDGYKIAEDGTCKKEDQCASHGHLCQQFCENRNISYVCKCAEGYELKENGHSCDFDKNHKNEGYMLLGVINGVRQLPLTDRSSTHKYTLLQKKSGVGLIESTGFMRRTNKIFVSTRGNGGSIGGELSVSENGSLKILRDNVRAGSIAVDWVGENVFIEQGFRASVFGISVCSMNGFFCRLIVGGEIKDSYGYDGLLVHPTRGLMFWIDTTKDPFRIMMANMDGTDAQVLVGEKIKYPHYMGIDYIRNDVYFLSEKGLLERINIDTRDRRVVVSGLVNYSSNMVFFNGLLYRGLDVIPVHDIAHNRSTSLWKDTSYRSEEGVAVNHSLYQIEPKVNPCSNSNCLWICVAVPGTNNDLIAKCLCPDGYKESPLGDTCIPPSTAEEIEQLEKYTHIGYEIMKEYCEAGVGCKNGGTCRDLQTKHTIVCDCVAPYDGLYCERLNPEMLASGGGGWKRRVVMIASITVSAFIIGLLIYFWFSKPSQKQPQVYELNNNNNTNSRGSSSFYNNSTCVTADETSGATR